MDLLKQILNFLSGLRGASTGTLSASPSTVEATTPQPALNNSPKLDPVQYKTKLALEVTKKVYEPGDGKTYCNYYIREVCRWFGYDDFKTPDRDQASEMARYMEAHPEHWYRLSKQVEYVDFNNKQRLTKVGADYQSATAWASQGHLVIAAQANPDPGGHGHVCIICPSSETLFSNKWGRPVPLAANVGASNWIDKALSFAFKTEPDLYLYLG